MTGERSIPPRKELQQLFGKMIPLICPNTKNNHKTGMREKGFEPLDSFETGS